MKKYNYFIVAAAIATLAACAQKEEFENDNLPVLGEERTVLYAVMEQEESDAINQVSAKATIDESNKLEWVTNDQIAVYTSASKFETLTLESVTDGVAKFAGDIDGTFNTGAVAVYPASAAKSFSDGKITVTYPDTYSWNEGSLNAPMIATVATATATAIEFKHLAGVVRFVCENVPEWAVSFVFESADKAVTGEFEVAAQPGTSTVSAVSGATTGNRVTYTFEKSSKNMTFYVPLPMGTYDDFSVWFEDENGNMIADSKVTAKSSANSIERKTILKMPIKIYEPWFTVNWVFGDASVALPEFKSQVPAIDNSGNTYVLSTGTTMYKLNAKGEKQWDFELSKWEGSSTGYLLNSPVLRRDGAAVYAAGGNAGTAALYGINSDGTQKFETTQSEFHENWVRFYQGRVVIGLSNRVIVHASGGRALHCFDEETGKRISYIAKNTTGDRLGTNAGDGTAIALDGAIAIATEGAMYGTDSRLMETPVDTYVHETNGHFVPYGFKMQHKGWGFKDHDAMAVVKSGNKSYFVRVGANSSAKDPRPHFTSTDKALNVSTPVEYASSSNYFQSLWYHCYQTEGGVIAGEDGEAIFTLMKNPDRTDSPAGIRAVIPSETYTNSEISKSYTFATSADVRGSAAIDNNGYIHVIDDAADYYIVDPDFESKTCSLVAKVNIYDLVKASGKLPEETLTSAKAWTSVKLGSDGKIYLNVNMYKSGTFAYGTTICLTYKDTTSPSLVSSWPQEQADPMNSGLQVR